MDTQKTQRQLTLGNRSNCACVRARVHEDTHMHPQATQLPGGVDRESTAEGSSK